MSGSTLIKNAESKIKIPVKIRTVELPFKIFISPSKMPVIAPSLAAPLQIPLQVILFRKERVKNKLSFYRTIFYLNFFGNVSGVITHMSSKEAVAQNEVI